MADQTNTLKVLLDALCCIMYADETVHPLERKKIYEILAKAKVPWSQDRIDAYIRQFIDRVHSEGLARLVQVTSNRLVIFKREDWERKILGILGSLMKADGVVDDREIQICKRFKAALRKPEVLQSIGTQPGSDDEAAKDEAQDIGYVPVIWEEGQTILDLYEVKKVHAGGGMGLVYKVHHKNWNADLAVKSPRLECFRTEIQKDNFIRECKTWIALGLHPHIVSCYYIRTLGDIPRVFAEYVEGGSLKDWIDNDKLYEGGKEKAVERILDIAIQFAWGLHYAHDNELIHQDIKPANVMMTPEGIVKVTDFGLAKARAVSTKSSVGRQDQSILVSTGGMTPAYCSPEQAHSQSLSPKTDIWSWGLSVLEMFTGGVFWQTGQAAGQVLESYLQSEHKDEELPNVPARLADLLRQCFMRAPEDRPSDMNVIADQLTSIYLEAIGQDYQRHIPEVVELLADDLNNRAVSLLDLDRSEEAEELFDRALQADPHHPETTYNRGILRWRSGRITDEDLVRQLEQVRSTHQDSWQDEYLLGLVHIERYDAERARDVLEEISPQAKDAKEIGSALNLARSRISCEQVRMLEHSATVVDLAISSDGCWALSAAKDGTVSLWDLSGAQCVGTLTSVAPLQAIVAVNENGSKGLIASGTALSYWDLQKQKPFGWTNAHAGGITSISITADGRWGFSGGRDATVRLWDLQLGTCVRTLCGHPQAVLSVNISSDGHWGVSGSWDEIRVWKLASGKCIRKYRAASKKNWGVPGGKPVCTAVNHDGSLVASASGDLPQLWDAQSGENERPFHVHNHYLTSVDMSDNGMWLTTATSDGTVRLFEVETGRCRRTFRSLGLVQNHTTHGLCHVVARIDRSAQRAVVASTHTSIIRLLDFDESVNSPYEIARPTPSEAVSKQRKNVDLHIQQASLALQEEKPQDAIDQLSIVRSISDYVRDKKILSLWHKTGLHCRRKSLRGMWRIHHLRAEGDISTMDMSDNGKKAIVASSSGNVLYVYDLVTGEVVHAGQMHSSWVRMARMTSDGHRGLSVDYRYGSTCFWDLSGGKCLWTIDRDPGAGATFDGCVDISPDGRLGLIGATINTIGVNSSMGRGSLAPPPFQKDVWLELIDLETQKCLRRFKGHKMLIYSVSISSDCRWAISSSTDCTLRFWELATGACFNVLKPPSAPCFIHLQSNGRISVLAADNQGRVHVWDPFRATGCGLLEGHLPLVRDACFTADGQWAMTGGDDKSVRVWHLETSQCLHVIETPTPITSLCLSTDGRWLLMGGKDGELSLWELDWEYEFPGWSDWDEKAKPYLEVFLTRQCSYGDDGISRVGMPKWDEEHFQKLIQTLQYCGYGWLRPEGVKKRLEEMTTNWQGPLPLPG